MMRMFWACALIRLKWWIRRPLEVAVLVLLVPVSMLLLFYLTQNTIQEEGIRVAVVDEDQSVYSQLVIERFASQPIIALETMTRETATRRVQANQVEAAIIFNDGFMDHMLQKEREERIDLLYSPSSLTRVLLSELVASEVLRLSSNVHAAHYVNDRYEQLGLLSLTDQELIKNDRVSTELWQKAWKESDSYWEPEPLMTIDYITAGEASPEETTNSAGGVYHIPLLMGCLSAVILFLCIFMQQWLVDDLRLGVRKRVKGMGVSPIVYVAGHSLPTFLFVMLQGYVAMILFFRINEIQLTWGLVILLLLYMMAACTFGTYIALLAKSALQLQTLGVLLVLLTSLAGGSFINLSEWSDEFRWLSYGTPQAWFLKGIRESMTEAMAPIIWPAGCVLVAFTLLFVGLSAERWRRQS